MRRERRSTAAQYEVVVAGALGPVLRLALEPQRYVRTEECTVFPAAPGRDRDLVDLLQRLHERGLIVESVTTVATSRTGGAREIRRAG
ncbi:MAG: hypothetical protein ACXVXC_08340 [Nocardioidaceae bacterium]